MGINPKTFMGLDTTHQPFMYLIALSGIIFAIMRPKSAARWFVAYLACSLAATSYDSFVSSLTKIGGPWRIVAFVAAASVVFTVKRRFLLQFMALAYLVNAASVAFFLLITGKPMGIILGNPSMNGSFMAAITPLLHWSAWPITFCILLASKASVPWLVFSVAAFFAMNPRTYKPYAVASIAGAAAVYFVPNILDSSGRYQTWQLLLNFMKEKGSYLFGNGFGTTGSVLLAEQRRHMPGLNNWFIFAHNDWLEIFFELGAVGLALAIAAWVQGLMRVPKAYVPTFMAFTAWMSMNYPWHVVPGIMVGMLLIKVCSHKEPV